MSSVAAPLGATTALADLDAITDEERLRIMYYNHTCQYHNHACQYHSHTMPVPEVTHLTYLQWQQAEDFGERRRIRARMYKLREQRLREMMQNDEEALGTLNVTDDSGGLTEYSTITVGGDGNNTSRRSSNIQVTMHVDGDSAVTESISTQNVRLGGLTMRGVDNISVEGLQPGDVIQERIRKASEDRPSRFQRIIGELSDTEANNEGDSVVSITKSTYSIQSNALAGEGYLSMKNKEVRDSVSPTRIMRERRSSAEDDTSANEGRLTSDDEAALKAESEHVIEALQTSPPKTSSSRKTSRDERTTTRTTKSRQSEIPVRKESSSSRKVSERKTSKELDFSSVKRTSGDKSSPTSPTKRTPGESSSRSHMPRRTGAQKEAPTSPAKSPTRTGTKAVPSSRKSKLAEVESKMETSIMSELDKLDSYLSASVNDDDEVIMEEEEDCVDEAGNVVKMLVQTRRKKDGTECTARRVARSTKVVNSESEIDEILIGNPDHEVLEREVAEEEDKDGNKIKIITETRQRPDGITYTTKNILKTSKIFDYDHPEDVAYNEEDELISTNETEETDENGITIQTVTETRRKPSGMEYTTKKVYKTSKVKSTHITPSDDDEVIDTKETEEKKDDGSIIRTVIEIRRTKTGEEYTHRQVFRSRRMTLSGVDLQRGLPTIHNDDEVIDKNEKEEMDDSGMTIKVVTETRRRKDGSTYSFEYVLRSFQGTEDDVKKMPVGGSKSSNIAVSADDELINEEIKEDVQEDGSTVKTIIERRRAKDGTEYLRHRIMRIPKMPEPVLQVANLEDEVLQEEVKEKTLNDGTHYKAVTERRRSSVSGLQYTLRRMSKIYQQPTHHPKSSEDEILDENVTEEETDDGTVVKTVIQRYQRPDGSVYTTHNIHRTFSSPAPVTFVGTENDELVDQSVDEQETADGYVIKSVTETRRRADGMQYTVERTEKTSKFGPEVHITFSGNDRSKKPEDVVQVGSPDDTVVSCEENEYEEEDGTVVKTVVEIRRRVDSTEYTTKTVLRSTPVLVPERETSYVVIKPEGGDEDEDVGFFPSLDDEVVYTRKKEEIGEDGQPITVIIETRQSKTTGEKYNITKRVHTTNVVMTEEGEREIPKAVMKSTLVANIAPAPGSKKPDKPTEEPEDDQDDVPYGSVSALKNRFAPAPSKKPESSDKTGKPDRANTLNKKRFFEDAAKTSAVTVPSSKTSPRKSEPKDRPREPDRDAKRDLLPAFSDDKASIEVKLRVEKDEATVENVETHKVTYHADEAPQEEPEDLDGVAETKNVDIKDLETEIAKLEEEEKERYRQGQPEGTEEPEDEVSPDEVEIEAEVSSPSEEEPQEPRQKKRQATKKTPTTSKRTEEKPRKKTEEPRKRREVSPRKKPETEEPSRRAPASRKLPGKDDSPTRRVPAQREPIPTRDSTRRAPKPNTSPQRVPSSPHRGRSPNRSGVSTPREVTPTDRQCCKKHREANEPEPVSPTRTQKTTPRSTVPSAKKTTSPEGKPRMNGDVRRTPAEPRVNGDINRKPEDRAPRTRRTVEKPSEPERPAVRPSRLSQTPRKTPTARSPDKREPTRPLSSRVTDRKSPTKPSEKSPKSRSPNSEPKEKPKSTLSVPESKDPVITLPETPMTEDIKPLPDDNEVGPVIEDVSCEPDLPYHTIHRPSIVREPSEYHAPDSQEEASDSSPERSKEPSDTELKDTKPERKSSKKPQEKETSPVKEDVSKPRKTKPLESRPSDKSLSPRDSEPARRKQPETRRTTRDRPWLTEKRNSFEKRQSEHKLSPVKPNDDKKTERKKPYERKPSEETIKKPKEEPIKKLKQEKPSETLPTEESDSPSDSESKENGAPEEITTDEAPVHEAPVYEAPVYEDPVHEAPVHEAPVHETPIHEALVHEAPVHEAPVHEAPQDDKPTTKKTGEITTKLSDWEKSVTSQIITEKNEKNITTSDITARRSAFNYRTPQPDNKKDKPSRKPSYEMKESVFSKRSLFEQPKQEPVPSPTRRPLLKTTTKKDDKPKRPEERKPVKEPIIVPKHIYPLGDDEDEPAEQPASEPVKEDIKMTSSKLVMSAMATSNQTRTTEVRKESTTYTPYVVDEDRPEESDTLVPLKKDRSPSPFMKESSSAPRSKEGSPTPRSKEGSPVPRSKESSPAPFSKEGSPSRFVTGKPIDSGINSNKIRRIERTGSNKKLLEDLEVSRESLPHYLSTIETIFDVTILENLLEKAESYEERRLIRGQLRLAKRPGAHQTTTPSRPSTTTTRAQPAAPRPTRPVVSEDLSLGDTTRKPLSKSLPSLSILSHANKLFSISTSSDLKTSLTVSNADITSSGTSSTSEGHPNPRHPRPFRRQNSRTDSDGFVLSPVRDKDGNPMVGVKGITHKIKIFQCEYCTT
ncbi:Repetitive proline-rich cell wall protein 1-like 1 [Homarus americanus]|uniref:Repetitive proline-rich cell wall protein 1-like 1 n=1 Tax=Homarus americanus TaxID=6706 RepID=A0A8J5K914_HOMAM|nr:Repetitive proline-rich cell wall protein 1-like 1 [Homarus americanus]